MEKITGTVERITYHSEVTGYTVIQLKVRGSKELIATVGNMGSLQPGELISCEGEWKSHPTYGKQFIVKEYRTTLPADCEGIKRYLGSGLIKGIGASYAEKIVNTFGLQTIDILDNDPDRLAEVPGLGAKRTEQIKEQWASQGAIKEVMIFLQGHGVSVTYGQKIWRTYGKEGIDLIRKDPYCLARDIKGIGFKIADKIALKMGIEPQSPTRLEAGLEYLLEELSFEGHTCCPRNQLIEKAEQHFEISAEKLESSLDQLIAQERVFSAPLVWEGQQLPFLWLRALWHCEKSIIRQLTRLRYAKSTLRPFDQNKAIDWVQQELKIELAKGQRAAVEASLKEKILVITGGPGTGKSTITKAILAISGYLTDKIALMAPTGRAAKRMSEITGKTATTIHSALEWNFQQGGFKRNQENPLDVELLIVDEVSMIDTYLFNSLLKALPDHVRLLLIGDVDQLPSVGPGTVLKDMINSKAVPVFYLKEIFRQAASSQIITNAHNVNRGLMPLLDNEKATDFFFVEREEPEAAVKAVVALCIERIPHRWGFDVFKEVQIIAPMKKGAFGVERLNNELQKAMNPQQQRPSISTSMGQQLYLNDKVIQLRNDYNNNVFNGDIGQVCEVNAKEKKLSVDFEGHIVEYEKDRLNDITLAYAITVHKFQGSQAKAIVICLHTSHMLLLHRNILYTAITRAEKLVVVVGSKKAISMAVHNNEILQRYTGLRHRLQGSTFNDLPLNDNYHLVEQKEQY